VKHVYVLAVAVFFAGACSQRSPAAPDRPAVPTPQSSDRPGTAHSTETIRVGETVRSAVSSDDVHCDTVDPTKEELEAPCKTFQFTAPGTGIFVANLHWPSSDIFMELLTPLYGACCRSPLSLKFSVEAGEIYTLSVGFHGIAESAPKGSAPFELTTSLIELTTAVHERENDEDHTRKQQDDPAQPRTRTLRAIF
jgi:hypothetical protein